MMKPEIADKLARITNRFYQQQASSFSATRKAPWRGWDRCLAAWVENGAADAGGTARLTGPAHAVPVLDAGCGNLRFERYLSEAHASVPWEYYAVDNCRPLLVAAASAPANLTDSAEPAAAGGSPAGVDQGVASLFSSVHFQELDIMPFLAQGPDALSRAVEAPPAALTVCFGLLHHVPTFERRAALLQALVEATGSGGVVCVSFWRFMANADMARKVRALQSQALADCGFSATDLDENDYLLGWNSRPGVYRYCHHFSESEIDRLMAQLGHGVRVIDRFVSDGRTGDLNAYVVLKVK